MLDKGRGGEVEFSGYEFAFRVVPLRNVELTAPYMHNGAYPTLESVLKHYTNPDSALRNYDVNQLRADLRSTHRGDATTIAAQINTLDFRMQKGIKLTEEERGLLVKFLRSLTESLFSFGTSVNRGLSILLSFFIIAKYFGGSG